MNKEARCTAGEVAAERVERLGAAEDGMGLQTPGRSVNARSLSQPLNSGMVQALGILGQPIRYPHCSASQGSAFSQPIDLLTGAGREMATAAINVNRSNSVDLKDLTVHNATAFLSPAAAARDARWGVCHEANNGGRMCI